MVAEWLERPPRGGGGGGGGGGFVDSIHGRDRPKSLKLVVVASPICAQDYGNSTTTDLPVSG